MSTGLYTMLQLAFNLTISKSTNINMSLSTNNLIDNIVIIDIITIMIASS